MFRDPVVEATYSPGIHHHQPYHSPIKVAHPVATLTVLAQHLMDARPAQFAGDFRVPDTVRLRSNDLGSLTGSSGHMAAV